MCVCGGRSCKGVWLRGEGGGGVGSSRLKVPVKVVVEVVVRWG